jgi:hypothetical protein
MLKLFAAVALLGSVSLVAMPAIDAVSPSHAAAKADRLETQTDTQVRNYLSPQLDGRPVGFCVAGEDGCGKDAADAFCREIGFAEAIMFQRDNGPLVVFRQIKCRRSAAVEAHRIIIEPAGAE